MASNSSDLDIAVQLVMDPAWRWWPGMFDQDGRVVSQGIWTREQYGDVTPDIHHGATKGVLINVIRTHYKDPAFTPRCNHGIWGSASLEAAALTEGDFIAKHMLKLFAKSPIKPPVDKPYNWRLRK